MRKNLLGLGLFLVGLAVPAAQTAYYPPPGEWARKSPAEVGMDAARLSEAVDTKQAQWPGSPANAFSARGQGGNIIFISPSHDLVVVWRWSAEANEGFRRVVASITS